MKKSLVAAVALVPLALGFGYICAEGVQGYLHIKHDLDLVAAASGGNAADVKALLAQGASPNATHIEGSSALWWAVVSGSPETVQVLLKAGANPNSRGQYNSVMEQALSEFNMWTGTPKEQNFRTIIKALVAKGAIVPSGVKVPG